MNTSFLSGQLSSDPVLRYTPSGKAVCNVNLAVANPESEAKAFVKLVIWDADAEEVASLRKGADILLRAKVSTRNYMKDGKKVYVEEFVVQELLDYCDLDALQTILRGVLEHGKTDQPESLERPES